MSDKHESDRQMFKNEIGKQHLDMERHFEQMQSDHVDRINGLKKQMEQITLKKNEELQKYVEEVRNCQLELKRMNIDREKRRSVVSGSFVNDGETVNKKEEFNTIANYLDFGKKNFPELQAELEYYIEKTQSLETELKTMNLELLYHRTEKDDISILKSNLEASTSQIQILKNENRNLNEKKEFFEKECNIQKA